MGKDSLIKSTAKSKKAVEEKEDTKKTVATKKTAVPKKPKAKAKKTAPPKAAKTVKKAAAKKKAPKKKTTATTPKATAAAKPKPAKAAAKKKVAVKPKAAKQAAPPKKKPTIRELLMKKFDSASPAPVPRAADGASTAREVSSPPFFADLSDAETKRLKALLLQKIDLPAQPPEPPAPADTPEPPPAVPTGAEVETDAPVAPAAPAPTPPPEKEPETSPEPETTDEISAPTPEEPADPAEKILKYMAGAFIFLVILVIGASFVNQGRFYLQATDGAVEIWQGKFAPKGQKLLVTLPGAELPELAPGVYTKKDVYPIAFNYYIDKADAILDIPGAPNFDEVKAYLETALVYAFSQDLRDIAYARLHYIDFLILMYKADVAASRETIESLKSALLFLAEAKALADNLQAQQIDQRIEALSAALASKQAAQAEAEQLEADRQKLEQAEAAHQD